jgi:hypothetical protein
MAREKDLRNVASNNFGGWLNFGGGGLILVAYGFRMMVHLILIFIFASAEKIKWRNLGGGGKIVTFYFPSGLASLQSV